MVNFCLGIYLVELFLCMVERAVEGFNGTLYELRYHVRQTMQAVQIIHALNAVKWYIGTGMEI